jgi:hypothetical protein
MPPATGTALIILVAFALPGFVTVLIQERTFKRAEDPTPLDRLLRVLYYSVWTYFLLALVALPVGVDTSSIRDLYDDHKADPAVLVLLGALMILVPSLVIATATRWWSGSRSQGRLLRCARINERHEEPTGWDYFFRQRRDAYVRVTLNNGGLVWGYYGGNSFAAYAKEGRDLFLERAYAPGQDKWFGEELAGGCGVWVNTEDVVFIEFYNPTDAAAEQAPSEAPEDRRPCATAEAAAAEPTAPTAEER